MNDTLSWSLQTYTKIGSGPTLTDSGPGEEHHVFAQVNFGQVERCHAHAFDIGCPDGNRPTDGTAETVPGTCAPVPKGEARVGRKGKA